MNKQEIIYFPTSILISYDADLSNGGKHSATPFLISSF